MSSDSDCIFCKIIAGTIPAHVIHEDDAVLAFLDASPLAPGHVLIVPKGHYGLLTEMPEAVAASMMRILPELGKAAMAVAQAPGFNILLNNGSVAGQVVQHVHIHLIPRRPDDGLGYRWPAGQYAEGEAERIQSIYRRALKAEKEGSSAESTGG